MDKDNLHHAYVIEGERNAVKNFIHEFLKVELGVIFENNPDLIVRDYETLNIDEAREVKEMASRKFFKTKRFFVLAFGNMGIQAQNSLLKILEEPMPDNHFFLITPNSSRLLPTLLSRVVHMNHSINIESADSLFITPEAFIKLSNDKRLLEIKNILTLLDKEKITKGEIVAFIKEVVKLKPSKQALKIVDYALDPSPSLKMLLEYLSVTM